MGSTTATSCDGPRWWSDRLRRRCRPETILRAALHLTGTDRDDFTGDGRRDALVDARALYAAACRALTWASWPEIARAVGSRHHATWTSAANRYWDKAASRGRVARMTMDERRAWIWELADVAGAMDEIERRPPRDGQAGWIRPPAGYCVLDVARCDLAEARRRWADRQPVTTEAAECDS